MTCHQIADVRCHGTAPKSVIVSMMDAGAGAPAKLTR